MNRAELAVFPVLQEIGGTLRLEVASAYSTRASPLDGW